MWLDFLSITRSSSSSARRWWPGVGQGTLYLTIMIAAVAFQLPHSREQEAEADRIEVMARAAYEPRAAQADRIALLVDGEAYFKRLRRPLSARAAPS